MRVLVINQHTQNFGDDAAGEALLHKLLDKKVVQSIEILHNGPVGDARLPDKRVRVVKGATFKQIGAVRLGAYFLMPRKIAARVLGKNLSNLIDSIRCADAVLVAPSGANIGIYRDWQYLTRLLIAVREGATPIFHWNTIGTSGSKLFDTLALIVLKRSRLYVRERASVSYLHNLGLESKLGPDTAFALTSIEAEVDNSLLSLVPAELDSWHPSFRTNPINSQFLAELTREIANFALTRGMRIDILPHLRSSGEFAFNERVRAELLRHGLPEDNVQIRVDVTDVSEYDRAIASSALVVGARYHAIVLAAKNFVPFVSLAYENKMEEVARYTDTMEYTVRLNDRADLGMRVRRACEAVDANAQSIRENLRNVVDNKLRPRISMPIEETISSNAPGGRSRR